MYRFCLLEAVTSINLEMHKKIGKTEGAQARKPATGFSERLQSSNSEMHALTAQFADTTDRKRIGTQSPFFIFMVQSL